MCNSLLLRRVINVEQIKHHPVFRPRLYNLLPSVVGYTVFCTKLIALGFAILTSVGGFVVFRFILSCLPPFVVRCLLFLLAAFLVLSVYGIVSFVKPLVACSLLLLRSVRILKQKSGNDRKLSMHQVLFQWSALQVSTILSFARFLGISFVILSVLCALLLGAIIVSCLPAFVLKSLLFVLAAVSVSSLSGFVCLRIMFQRPRVSYSQKLVQPAEIKGEYSHPYLLLESLDQGTPPLSL